MVLDPIVQLYWIGQAGLSTSIHRVPTYGLKYANMGGISYNYPQFSVHAVWHVDSQQWW